MDKPIFCDQAPEMFEGAGGELHVIFKSLGEVVAHIVMDRLSFSQGTALAERTLAGRRPRAAVTPLRPE